MQKFLLLITTSPHYPNAKKALDFAHQQLADGHAVQVFFYGDGAYTANRLMWQTADVLNVADGWVALSTEYGLGLPVCVSTALARGIADKQNAQAHQLNGENLRKPFCLVGLSQLALSMNDSQVIQF